jgi:hypothetical protein
MLLKHVRKHGAQWWVIDDVSGHVEKFDTEVEALRYRDKGPKPAPVEVEFDFGGPFEIEDDTS